MHFEELWEGLEVNNSTLNHTWYFQFLGLDTGKFWEVSVINKSTENHAHIHFEELWEVLEVNNSTLNNTWFFQFLGFGDWEILGSFGIQQINRKSRIYAL